MAALNFPNSPSLNDTHTENGVTFKWNGAAWDRLGDIGAQGSAGAAGAQGAAGATGAQGATGPVAGSSSQVVYKDGSNNPAGSSSFTFDGTNLTVGGNVSIGGTLTYEDVTNIDSVGVITARNGIIVNNASSAFDPHLTLFAENSNGGILIAKHASSYPDLEFRTEAGGGSLDLFKGIASEQAGNSSYYTGLKLNDNNALLMGTGGDSLVRYDSTPGVLEIKTLVSEPITLSTNDTERLRIHSHGQLELKVPDANPALKITPSGTNAPAVIDFNTPGTGVAKLLVQGTERFRITSSGVKQVLNGNLNIYQTYIDFSGDQSSTPNTAAAIFRPADNTLAFSTANVERLRINSAGEVYIGSSTANGQGKLFVNDSSGATTTQAHIRNASSTGTAKVFLNLDDGKYASVGLENGSLIFRNSTSSTPTERLRITSDGKLMTQSAGYIYTASSAGSLSLYGGNTNLGGGIVLSGGNTNGNISFYAQMSTTSPAHRMTIGTTGQVEVSNTVSSNDAAVNIYKASGSNSDKAILRVGYDAAAAFEIYRIRNNGTIYMGPNQSGAALTIQNCPTGGSITERLVLQPTGNLYYYGTSGSNQIISQRTNSAGSDGDYFFHLRAQNSSSQDCGAFGIHRDGANDGGRFSVFTRNSGGSNTERIRVDQAGTLRVAGAIASMAGDNSLTDFSAGRVQATRFRRGTSNGSRYGGPTGYLGDMLSSDGPPMSHVFYMGQLNSSSSSNATQNMFSYYTSGHWGQYTSMRVWMHVDYYNHGYQVWDVYNGSITSIASRGSGGNLTSSSAQLVGSGTHGGQNVYRYDVTVENPGTYFQVRWYLGLYFGAANGVYSNAYSASSMDTYLSTRGSGIHFKGLNAAALSSCPLYRTQ